MSDQAARGMRNILVIHGLSQVSRRTNIDHVLCFSKLVDDLVVFHHYNAPLTEHLRQAKFDLVILCYCFAAERARSDFWTIVRRYDWLKDQACEIVLVPQDEYTWCLKLDELTARWGVRRIMTALSADLDALYPKAIAAGVQFSTVLTGYFEPSRLETIASFAKPHAARRWDVGTRVNLLKAYLGRGAQNKGAMAEAFRDRAIAAGLDVNISTSSADTFAGDDWFRFLGDCRFTVSSRGGASMFDPDGSRRMLVNDYIATHPDAEFDEIEKACFPGEDRFNFSAIGPRIIEAAATETCQILQSNETYLEGMEAWVHFVPFAPDFSNFDDVVAAARKPGLSAEIARRCRELVIGNPNYTYDHFVDMVVGPYGLSRITPDQKRRNTALIQRHFEIIAPFERLREGLGPVSFAALMTSLWRQARFHSLLQVRSFLDSAGSGGSLSTRDAVIAAHPYLPHSRFEIEALAGCLADVRRRGRIQDVVTIVDMVVEDKLPADIFLPWDFCDYTLANNAFLDIAALADAGYTW